MMCSYNKKKIQKLAPEVKYTSKTKTQTTPINKKYKPQTEYITAIKTCFCFVGLCDLYLVSSLKKALLSLRFADENMENLSGLWSDCSNWSGACVNNKELCWFSKSKIASTSISVLESRRFAWELLHLRIRWQHQQKKNACSNTTVLTYTTNECQ